MLKQITLVLKIVQVVVIDDDALPVARKTVDFGLVGLTVPSVNQTRITQVLLLVAVIEDSTGAGPEVIHIVVTLRYLVAAVYHLSRGLKFFRVVMWVVVMNLVLTLRELLGLTAASLANLRRLRRVWSKAFSGPSMSHRYHLVLEEFLLVGLRALQSLPAGRVLIFLLARLSNLEFSCSFAFVSGRRDHIFAA